MGSKLNKKQYEKLIKEDLDFLNMYCPDCPELDRIKLILCKSIDNNYSQYKYQLPFTEKELRDTIDGINTYSALTNGVYDENIVKERHRTLKSFDTSLARIGLKRKFD